MTFSLYVHWPYCIKRCPYCDFNAHLDPSAPPIRADHISPAPKTTDQYLTETMSPNGKKMAAALLGELHFYRQPDIYNYYFTGRKISSIFFGGGTPSLMPPQLVRDIIATARDLYGFTDDIEITLEANPGTLEGGGDGAGSKRLSALADAGINRLSLGVQALDPDALRLLGRIHDSTTARAVIKQLPTIFSRWSFDLIYSRPDQTLGQWQDELSSAIDQYNPRHLSLYQLTIEPGTEFFRHQKSGLITLPDDDISADFFVATHQLMAARGLPAYEISNFAMPGEESRHNLTYWRSGDWLGIGAGAHSRLTPLHHLSPLTRPSVLPALQSGGMTEQAEPIGAALNLSLNTHQYRPAISSQPADDQHPPLRLAISNFRLPDKWAAMVNNTSPKNTDHGGGHNTHGVGIEKIEHLGHDDIFAERLMMGLRLTAGITIDLAQDLSPDQTAIFTNKWQDLVDANLAYSPTTPPAIKQGLTVDAARYVPDHDNPSQYTLTQQGLLRLNSVLGFLCS